MVGTLREVTTLQRLKGLIIILGRRVAAAVVQVVAQSVKIWVVSWVHYLAEVSLPSNLLRIRVWILSLTTSGLLSSIFRQLVKTIV